jgi:hypothetical protein
MTVLPIVGSIIAGKSWPLLARKLGVHIEKI